MAKEEYIEKYCNNAPIDHYCFACEYAYRKAKEKYDDKYYIAALRCEFCPLNWGTSGDEEGCYMCECNDFDYESGLYAQCRNMRGSSKDSWKKQAKLAYKIAMLPESEKE